MDFFQKSTFLHGGILCSNAHILSKRRTPTPIISGVKGLFCGFVASKCRIPLSKHTDFGRFLLKLQVLFVKTSYFNVILAQKKQSHIYFSINLKNKFMEHCIMINLIFSPNQERFPKILMSLLKSLKKSIYEFLILSRRYLDLP